MIIVKKPYFYELENRPFLRLTAKTEPLGHKYDNTLSNLR